MPRYLSEAEAMDYVRFPGTLASFRSRVSRLRVPRVRFGRTPLYLPRDLARIIVKRAATDMTPRPPRDR